MIVQCEQCGYRVAEWPDEICNSCQMENAIAQLTIDGHISRGHTEHCAMRQARGDGECECRICEGEE